MDPRAESIVGDQNLVCTLTSAERPLTWTTGERTRPVRLAPAAAEAANMAALAVGKPS